MTQINRIVLSFCCVLWQAFLAGPKSRVRAPHITYRVPEVCSLLQRTITAAAASTAHYDSVVESIQAVPASKPLKLYNDC